MAFAALLATPAQADEPKTPGVITPQEVMVDPNGVNLYTGKIKELRPQISIPAAPRLTYSAPSDFAIYIDGQINVDSKNGKYSVSYGGLKSESFSCMNGDCVNVNSRSRLSVANSGSGTFYHEETGVSYSLHNQVYSYEDTQKRLKYTEYFAGLVVYPDGENLTLSYEDYPVPNSDKRLDTVTSNTGYFLDFDYWDSLPNYTGWGLIESVTIYAVDAPTVPLARLSYSSDGSQITDLAGRTWTCASICGNYAFNSPWGLNDSVTLPGESSPAIVTSGTPGDAPVIQTVTHDGVAWNYSYTGLVAQTSQLGLDSYKYDSVSIDGPNGYHRTYAIQSSDSLGSGGGSPRYRIQYPTSSTDEFGKTTNYQFELKSAPNSWRLKKVTNPEGNSTEYTYDDYGNIIAKLDRAKPGSGLTDILQEAAFGGSGCTWNEIQCWRPLWSRDALGNQTDYTFNSRGQLTKQVEPTDDQGVHRITTDSYTLKTVSSGQISRKTETAICGGTGTTCDGANLSRVTYTYWNNTFLPSSETRHDPATGETRTTNYAYDAAGRLLSADGPLAGTDDKVFYRYDTVGRKTWEIGALAPNGLRIATRTHYRDADDKPDYVETGTLSSPTDTSLVVFDRVDYTYDSRRNPVRVVRSAGGTPYTVADASFLDRGLAECTAVRMNPAAFSATPGACTLGTQGSNGPDRITRNLYDARGQLVQVRKAVGTPIEIADVTYTYTDNGLTKNVIDANGNKAELRYDGFDRQSRWVFPSQTKPTAFNISTPATAISSAGSLNEADYEAYGYDANGNRTSLRKRDGSDIAYTYDNLNRMMVKDVDANNERTDLAAADRRDVYYAYDLNNVQTSARFGSASGQGILTVPDGFGEITSATNTLLAGSPVIAHQYDKAGNVTKITYPDGPEFDYAYDALNRIATIKKGATTLLTPSYSDRGLVSGVDRYNAALDQGFGYDAIGRLSALDIGSSGQSHSAKVGWDFTRNAASQILTDSRDNDSYAWNGRQNGSLAYTANGLNQYSAVGGNAYCYDANGNLTDDGESVYKYDVENRLVEMRVRAISGCPSYTSGYGGALLASLDYDPLGRLSEALKYENGSLIKTTRFLYDGDAMVMEYDGTSTIVSRYVHGNAAGADDPLLWYNGSGTADSAVRNLYADPRGSIVLVQGQDGTAIGINRYDEWGNNEGDWSTGRFQYTGQVWLDELGMYYYKARIYSSVLGRFMQADPIGYEDQVNLYAYVANDPINSVDPTGLYECGKKGGDACEAAAKATSEIRAARDYYNSPALGSRIARSPKAAAALDKTLSTLGKENDGNGLTIKVGDVEGRGRGEFDPSDNSITLDLPDIKATGVRSGEVLAHETQHYRQRNQNLPNPDEEVRPIIMQYIVSMAEGGSLFGSNTNVRDYVTWRLPAYCTIGGSFCTNEVRNAYQREGSKGF